MSKSIIEWHKIKTRPLTEEEKAEYVHIVMPDCIFDCEMPKDGQETLIATKYDTSIDIFHYDIDGSYFEDHDDCEDVIAWAELPKYEEGETE